MLSRLQQSEYSIIHDNLTDKINEGHREKHQGYILHRIGNFRCM